MGKIEITFLDKGLPPKPISQDELRDLATDLSARGVGFDIELKITGKATWKEYYRTSKFEDHASCVLGLLKNLGNHTILDDAEISIQGMSKSESLAWLNAAPEKGSEPKAILLMLTDETVPSNQRKPEKLSHFGTDIHNQEIHHFSTSVKICGGTHPYEENFDSDGFETDSGNTVLEIIQQLGRGGILKNTEVSLQGENQKKSLQWLDAYQPKVNKEKPKKSSPGIEI